MALTEVHRSGRSRILVVDDDPIIRTFCTKTLNQAGYGTLAATGSSDAMWLTASSSEPFDLLVVDVFLPISTELQLSPIQNVYPPVNGDEMVRQMLAIVPELRVLFISISSPENLLKEGIDLGPAPFLQKPLATETLLRSVKATLEAPPLRLDTPGDTTRSPGGRFGRYPQLAA
jgi:two-component system, cell cycle sensor histidine kinase and response regulator CckA